MTIALSCTGILRAPCATGRRASVYQQGLTCSSLYVRRADRPEIIKVSADAVRIAITHGIAHEAAGEEALDFMRSVLGVRLGQLSLMRGESTRHKLVLVKDLAPAVAFDKLQAQLNKQKAL